MGVSVGAGGLSPINAYVEKEFREQETVFDVVFAMQEDIASQAVPDHLYNFRVDGEIFSRVCGSYDIDTLTGFVNKVIKLDEL